MPAWFWELHGVELLGAMVVMIATALGTVVSAVWAIGRGIEAATKLHDYRQCKCRDCRRKLYQARRKRGDQVIGFDSAGFEIWDTPRTNVYSGPPGGTSKWLTTAQLRQHDTVEFGGTIYLIREIRIDRKGYAVFAKNVRNQNLAILEVPFDNANIKWWKPLGRGPE